MDASPQQRMSRLSCPASPVGHPEAKAIEVPSFRLSCKQFWWHVDIVIAYNSVPTSNALLVHQHVPDQFDPKSKREHKKIVVIYPSGIIPTHPSHQPVVWKIVLLQVCIQCPAPTHLLVTIAPPPMPKSLPEPLHQYVFSKIGWDTQTHCKYPFKTCRDSFQLPPKSLVIMLHLLGAETTKREKRVQLWNQKDH